MLHFLLAMHFVLTLAIIGLILLQKHDSDGALGSSGGGAASSMFSVRGQANILTKSTAILMTIFALNCLVMAKMVKSTPTKKSVIDRVAEESREKVPQAKNTEEKKTIERQSEATINQPPVDVKTTPVDSAPPKAPEVPAKN